MADLRFFKFRKRSGQLSKSIDALSNRRCSCPLIHGRAFGMIDDENGPEFVVVEVFEIPDRDWK